MTEPRKSPEGSLSSSPVVRPTVPQIPGPQSSARAISGRRSPDVQAESDPPSMSVSLQHDLAGQGFSIETLSDEQKARILRRHLVTRAEARRASETVTEHFFAAGANGDEEEASPRPDEPRDAEADETAVSSYHQRLGGEVVHDLYRWEDRQNQRDLRRPRSASFTGVRRPSFTSDDPTLDIKTIREPGGFRRNYLQRKAVEEGEPERAEGYTRTFIDFLSLYGHFGGEMLEEIDEDDEDAEVDDDDELENGERRLRSDPSEHTPLIRQSSTKRPNAVRRRSSMAKNQKGDATVMQAVLMLLKSFVGTGVLFLGKAFENGGIGFSSLVLVGIALTSLYSFLLLVKTRLTVPHSFGDIGGILYGNWLRICILFSITISQIGFVAAYTIFVAQNLQAFVMTVTDCRRYVPIIYLILAQMLVYMPLAMFRDIQKLSGTALVADVFILIGLIYIFGTEFRLLGENGPADIQFFNPTSYPLLIGTAVFAFEGVGLVIPITEAMREPEKFPRVLSGVMIGVMVLFAGAGALGDATFGSDIQTVVLVNLPPSKFVTVVQFLYAVAISLSTPLQLFPAVRIMENGIFSKSGKYNVKVKWQKNFFRFSSVVGTSMLAWAGARDLDKFVSLVGSVACVPLCFCYPAMLHYKIATTTRERVIDILLFLFGCAAIIFTGSQTIAMLASSSPSGPPRFGDCPMPPS